MFFTSPPKHTHQSKDQPLQNTDLGDYTCSTHAVIWQNMLGTPLLGFPPKTHAHSFEFLSDGT